jgi:Xaa-Pro dipeptidase
LPRSEAEAARFRARQQALAGWLAAQDMAACVIEDGEGARNSMLRWLTGHPMDANLFVFASGKTVLVPWDVTMAAHRAVAGQVIASAEFSRSWTKMMTVVLADNGAREGARVELQGRTSVLRMHELERELPGTRFVVRPDGFEAELGRRRLIKDGTEIASLERAAAITNELVDLVAATLGTRGGADGVRELDMAQLIEREGLARGGEGTGFETIAAGPARSWGIHASPSYTAGPFAAPGLSILDFGIKVDGYTSDVTMTIARGKLSAEQETMIALVEKAYAAAVAAAVKGASPQAPARAVQEVFSAAGWTMPHGLGHGIGLDAHEGPGLRATGDPNEPALVPGMVFTIEPGLYHPVHGGVRWENDVLVEPEGARVLTNSRIVRLP